MKGQGNSGRRWHLGLVTLMATLASGCSLVGGKPEPVAVYDLRLGTSPAVAVDAVRWQLTIDEPDALAPVAGVRIVTRAPSGALGVLAGGRWAARGPELVQAVLVQGFAASGRIAGAARVGSGVSGDCTLLSDLQDFQHEQTDRVVRVSIAATLVCGPAGQVAAARSFSSEVPVTGRGLPPVVAAFRESLGELLPELVAWTLAAGSEAIDRPLPDPR